MSVSVSTTAGNQVTVTVDGATQLSFTTQDSSISVVNGDTSSISVTNQGPKGDTGLTGPQGPQGPAGSDGADADLNDVVAVYETVNNASGGTMGKGTPVHIIGEDASGNPTVIRARADSSGAMPCHFVLNESIADGATGQAILSGMIGDVNTSGFSAGDALFVAATGGYTTTKPTGTNLIQKIAVVSHVDSSEGTGYVMGAGRSNDVPNIPDGQIWIGNASGVATPTAFGVDLDSTPQLGGDLDVNGNKIVSSSNGDIVIDPNGTGAIIFKSDDIQFDGDGGVGTGKIKLYESDVLGSNFIALSAPLGVTSDTTFQLPDGSGVSGQVLKTNGLSPIASLSWTDIVSENNPDFVGYLDIRAASAIQPATLFIYDVDGSNYVSLGVPDVVSSNVNFKLPGSDGSAGQVLKTDGSGNLSFVDQTTDTNTNLGNTDLTLDASRVVEMGSNSLDFQSSSVSKFKIFNTGSASATSRFTVNGNGTVSGQLRVSDAASSNVISLQHPDSGSGYTLKLPTTDGSAGQVLKTDGSGNLSFGDRSNKITQVFNMNFFDDLSTFKHYLPWKDINEQTLNYQDESAFLMPFDGRIVSISINVTALSASGNITMGVETKPTGLSPFSGANWTIEETEVLSVTATDDNHTFHFVFDNASHFEAGDFVALSVQCSTDVMTNSYVYATAVVEYDTSSSLGSSSTEHDSNP